MSTSHTIRIQSRFRVNESQWSDTDTIWHRDEAERLSPEPWKQYLVPQEPETLELETAVGHWTLIANGEGFKTEIRTPSSVLYTY